MGAIFQLASADSYVRDMQIAARLTELLTCLMEDAWNPELTGSPGTKRLSVREVRAYISDHYGEKLSLDSLSKRFFINKYYLAKIFKEQYGYTVNACIAQVRIGKAKELLRFSDRSVEAIGFDCGFTDPNYFARCFKKWRASAPASTGKAGKRAVIRKKREYSHRKIGPFSIIRKTNIVLPKDKELPWPFWWTGIQ